MEHRDPCLHSVQRGVERVDHRLTRDTLRLQLAGQPRYRTVDRGDPFGQRVGTVAGGVVERGLVGADHRQHRLALRRDALSRLVDRLRRAVEQLVDGDRDIGGDVFQMLAGGPAGRLHLFDMVASRSAAPLAIVSASCPRRPSATNCASSAAAWLSRSGPPRPSDRSPRRPRPPHGAGRRATGSGSPGWSRRSRPASGHAPRPSGYRRPGRGRWC